ncbi:MAG: ATP synthase F1 subunit gamma [Acidobacteria bacterium]|nr:ATP synthase F1 subunit gamma [Acidobacteriota bacterium]
MPSIQDLRRRIRAVRNMQQVTRAMKMVSAAKLRRAQGRVLAARPYANKMVEVLRDLADRAEGYTHPLLEQRGDDHLVLVLITADRGLCGAFNTNLIRAAQQFLHQHVGKQLELFAIGKRGRDFFRRRQVTIRQEYINVTAKQVEFIDAQEIARKLINDFSDPDQGLDRIILLYNEFKSVMQQRIVIEQLLPLGGFKQQEPPPKQVFIDYLYEQPPAEIFGSLLPHFVETQIYRALLESSASEHGARMVAMDAATKNAKELIDGLTLRMNRARQSSITKEIIEIVSGAAALEEMGG